MKIRKNEIDILSYLMHQQSFVSYKDIAESFSTSERMVRNHVDAIETFLEERGFRCVERKYGKGVRVCVTEELKNFVTKWQESCVMKQYSYSDRERHNFILNRLLLLNEPILQKEFAITLSTSTATISRHIRDIAEEMAAHDLRLVRNKNSGFILLGDELKRQWFILQHYQSIYSYSSLKAAILKESEAAMKENTLLLELLPDRGKAVLELVENFENKNGVVLDDITALRMLLQILILILRLRMGILKSGYRLPTLSLYPFDLRKYEPLFRKLSDAYEVEIQLSDKEYLMACIQSEIQNNTSFIDRYIQGTVHEIVERMITIYEEVSGSNLEMVHEPLHDDLMRYIQSLIALSIFRLPINVKYEYRNISITEECLICTKMAIGEIEALMERRLNDDEIFELAACFQAEEIKMIQEEEEGESVLLVCGSGIGISKLIAMQIKKQFHVNAVLTIPARKISEIPGGRYKHIISTIQLDHLMPEKYLLISPSYTEEDQRKIAAELSGTNTWKVRYDYLVSISKRLIDRFGSHMNLRERQFLQIEFLNELMSEEEQMQSSEWSKLHKRELNIWDVISKDMIQLQYHADDLYDAVRAGVHLIEKTGAVDQGYAETIIKKIDEYGPYMAILPGVFFSHAENREHTNSVAVSLLVLDEAIYVGQTDYDPIKIIVTLATPDDSSHLKAIAQMLGFLRDKINMKKVCTSKSCSYVYKIILDMKGKELYGNGR